MKTLSITYCVLFLFIILLCYKVKILENIKSNILHNNDQSTKNSIKHLFKNNWMFCQPKACSTSTDVLFLIISATKDIKARKAIRESWMKSYNRNDNISFVFLVGCSNQLYKQLLLESNYFKDMIINPIEERYKNLPLKILAGFSWILNNCHKIKYVLKLDDDVYIHIRKLLIFLKKTDFIHTKPIIYGNLAFGWEPVRNQNSKYYVSFNQYKESNYPTFATGPSYVISLEGIEKILEISSETIFFPLEDVLITGILADKANISLKFIQEFRNNGKRILNHFMSRAILTSISIHKILPQEQDTLYNIF